MKIQTQVKAGGINMQHNQTQVAQDDSGAESPDLNDSQKQAPTDRPGTEVETQPPSPDEEGMSWNHNQTLVRMVEGKSLNHNQTLLRKAS